VASVAQPGRAARLPWAGLDYHWQALICIVLGSFMVVLDTTIVNIALPRVIQVFQSTVDEGDIVLTGYMLALAVVMPATGYLSDTFGAKRMYIATISLFTVGSLLCGLAPNMTGLVLFRVLQGLGGGMTQPLGMSILLQTVPAHRRGSIMGIYGLPLLVAPAIGPTLGGYLVEYVDWRWIFTLNVPVGILAVIMGLTLLRETPRQHGARFDWVGFSLAAVGFSAALLALSKAPADGWTAPHIVVLWLVAAAAIPCWVIVELSQDQPLLDLTVLRDRTFLLATLVMGAAMIALYSVLLLLPLFLQGVRGLGAMETGMLLLPNAVAAAITMPISGRLLDRFGARPLAVPGLLLMAYATWLLVGLDPGTPDVVLFWALALRGLATGILFMPVLTVAMENIPGPLVPRATALANVLRQLSGAFGTAIFASLLLDRERFHQAILAQLVTPSSIAAVRVLGATETAMLQRGMDAAAAHTMGLMALAKQVQLAASVRAFDDCFFVGTLVCLLGVLPALFLKKRARRRPAGHAEPVVEIG
jgi:EmrB/QacA subfamily drug resistance transporter